MKMLICIALSPRHILVDKRARCSDDETQQNPKLRTPNCMYFFFVLFRLVNLCVNIVMYDFVYMRMIEEYDHPRTYVHEKMFV